MPNKKSTQSQPGLIIPLALLFAALIAAGSEADTGESLLFVQNATSGSLVPIDQTEGTYTLTLQNADPEILFYANRPDLDVGTMSAADLFEFLFEPGAALPNGALVIDQAEGERQLTFGFQFMEGSLQTDGEVVYTVRRLDELTGNASDVESDELADLPTELGNIELFLDSGGANSCTVNFSNKTAVDLTLASLDPGADSWKWANSPPSTVPANEDVKWVFRYHSNTEAKNGTVTYETENGGTVEIDMKCTSYVIGGNTTQFECNYSGNDGYGCNTRVGSGYNNSANIILK